jgi:hypothetical protein
MRALAARGGNLYVAAKNFSDDWAIGVSTDEGVTIARLAKYDQVSAIRPCVQALCASNCMKQAEMQIWPASVCGTSTQPPPPPPKKGGGCAIGAEGGASAAALPALAALAALCLARLRRRR